jgi:hypothetical protein
MKPEAGERKVVYQTIHEFPNGNCFQACVATIFGVPLEVVPHFFAGHAGNNTPMTQEEWDAIRFFAMERDCNAFYVEMPEEPDLLEKLLSSDLDYVAIGPSYAGDWGHCVVGCKGKFVHDPAGDYGRFLAGKPWLYIAFEKGEVAP